MFLTTIATFSIRLDRKADASSYSESYKLLYVARLLFILSVALLVTGIFSGIEGLAILTGILAILSGFIAVLLLAVGVMEFISDDLPELKEAHRETADGLASEIAYRESELARMKRKHEQLITKD